MEWAGPAGNHWVRCLEGDDRAALAAEMEKRRVRPASKTSAISRKRTFMHGGSSTAWDARPGTRLEAMRGTPEGLVARKCLKASRAVTRCGTRFRLNARCCFYGKGETEKFREELLKSTPVSVEYRAPRHGSVRILVRQMAKKLAARYAKTRPAAGWPTGNWTRAGGRWRRNMGWGGIPFITVWKQKRIEKPRVMVLCDVSGSVAAMSGFLLMFLYALNEALSDIRSFAFADR